METKEAIESAVAKLATNTLISEVTSTKDKQDGCAFIINFENTHHIAHVFSFGFELTFACCIKAVE